jgi:hypothetical protein
VGNKSNCGAVLLQAERIEEAAWRLCQEAIKQFPSAEDWRTILLDERVEEPLPSRESLDAALVEVEAGIARLLAMVRQNTITLEEATREIQAGKKEAARLQRQLSAIDRREESDRKWLALLEDEVRHLDVLKARMVDADPATRQDIINRLLTSATVKTHGSGRRKTGEVTFKWWYAVESVEVVTSRSSKRSS